MASCHACVNILCRLAELCRERLSAAAGLVRVRIDELEIAAHEIFLIIELCALEIDRALGINDHFYAVEIVHLIVLADLFVKVDRIAQPGTATTLHAEAEPAFRDALDVNEALYFLDCRLCMRDY